uniref:Gly-zipper_Omp domain-containing protein n=1 Tax=Caenorhabditis tropicalis TaxID=1561998 RepID=A0A1I7UR92_9PELO
MSKNKEQSEKKKKKTDKNWISEDPGGKAVHFTAASAQTAGRIGGEGLATIGQAAPVLQVAAAAYDAYQIGRNVEKDKRKGTTRNTVKKVTTTVATYGLGIGGAVAGAAIGTAICPGVGTIVGTIVGGLSGGIGGGYGSGKAAEAVMDKVEYDTYPAVCATCGREFLCRKYHTEDEENCEDCQEE